MVNIKLSSIIKLFLFIPFVACYNTNVNKEEKLEGQTSHVINSSIISNTHQSLFYGRIDSFSVYIFDKNFNDIKNDKLLLDEFKVKVGKEEDEGIIWDSYSLFKDNKLEVLLENNWEDKTHVTRITFLGSYFRTKQNIMPNSSFADIKNVVDENRLNNSEDGRILLYDSLFPKLVYAFNLDLKSNIYYGIENLNQIPDTLKINSIVVFK